MPFNKKFFRFSLRAFLIVLTVFCVWLGKISIEARRQKEAVGWVKAHGGQVNYDWDTDADGSYIPRRSFSQQYPEWLGNLVGRDYFQTAISVDVSGTSISDISSLASLPYLKVVRLTSNDIEDISPLASLTDIRYLWLFKNRIENLAPLSSMANLRVLLADRNSITDVEPLMKLKNLKSVSLSFNPVSNESIERLRKAHPNCKVRVFPQGMLTGLRAILEHAGLK